MRSTFTSATTEQWELATSFCLNLPSITPTSLFHSVVFSKDRVAKAARWGSAKKRSRLPILSKEMSIKGKGKKGRVNHLKLAELSNVVLEHTPVILLKQIHRIFIFSCTKVWYSCL